MTSSTNPEFHSANLLVFLYRWRKHLIFISLGAAVVAAIVSFIITPKYKSTAVIFPTMMNTASKALLEEFTGTQKDHLQFGEEEQVEQTMQVLKSTELMDRVVAKYDLMKHYGIDPNKPKSRTYLMEEFGDAVRFKPTEYMSIKIDVMDRSPDTAALIANCVLDMLDSVKTRLTKERAAEALAIAKKEYDFIVNEVSFLEDSMEYYRAKGIYEHDVQVEAYAKGYAKALAAGNSQAAKQLEEKLKIFETYGGPFLSLREKLWISRDRLKVLKYKYEQSLADYNNSLPFKFVVDRAKPADKKSTPIRWLIVVISTISAFAMTVVTIILIENISKIKFD